MKPKKKLNPAKKKLKDCKSLDKIEDNDLVEEMFNSKQFSDIVKKEIKKKKD